MDKSDLCLILELLNKRLERLEFAVLSPNHIESFGGDNDYE